MSSTRDPGTESRGPMGHVELQILLLLAARPCHGYEMMREIPRVTGGAIAPGPGTLYVALRRMGDDGRIRRTDKVSGTTARRCYRITARGQKALHAELDRIDALLRQARSSGWKKPEGQPA